jgi:flagellar motor switch protein FliG
MAFGADPLRKIALVLAGLETDLADELLEQLPPEQAAAVRERLMELSEVDAAEQTQAIAEFLARQPERAKHRGGVELDADLAARLECDGDPAALSDPAERPSASRTPAPRGPAREVAARSAAARRADEQDRGWPPFGFLQQAPIAEMVPLLRGEHPQTIAQVAAHLTPERAAELLAELSPALQADVIRRLVDLDDAHPEILRELETGLRAELGRHARRNRRKAGISALTAILQAASRQQESELLASLSHHEPELADRLGSAELTFQELTQLDQATIARVLSAADPTVVVLALASADYEFVERILHALPQGQTRSLERTLKHLGPTRLRDMEEAQALLVETALRLEALGQIRLPRRARMSVTV